MASKATKPLPPRGATNRRALLGSGKQIDLSDATESQRKKKRAQGWQPKAWEAYYSIPEIAYAFTLVNNVLRRAQLTIAIPGVDGGEPEVVDAEDTTAPVKAARDALDRVAASDGGQGAIIAALAVSIGIVGEGYLVGWHPDSPDIEEWDVFSPQQVTGEGTDWYLQTAPGQSAGQGTKLTEADSFVCRIWNRDPQWRDLAFSAMRPLLDICDDLIVLTRAIRAAALSQLAGAGMLLVPDEISFGSVDPTEDTGTNDADPLTQDLIDVMTTPIEDPSSPAATVPFVVRGPSDFLKADVFRLITFARNVDPEQAKQRDECLNRIANGLDLPSEMVLGLKGLNHWSAATVDDQAFTEHFEPMLVLICWGLTSGYLRPALRGTEAEGQNFMVWYDASAIVKHPNQSVDAENALENGAIGYAPYRRAKGFTEADAMDPEDFSHWQEVQAAKRGSPPVGDNPADPSLDTVETPTAPKVIPSDPAPIQASARDRLPVGSELVEIERITRQRLLDAADAAMARTIEVAGAFVRRKVGARGAVAQTIKDVPNAMVAATLGRDVVAQFADNSQLLDADFPMLAAKWDALTIQAQRRVADIARREGADIDPDEYVTQHEDARNAGWQALVAGLTGVAALRLYAPDPDIPPLGEWDSTSTVPVGIIRGALSFAGGSNGQLLDSGAMVTLDSDGRQIAAGGIATGPDALGALADAGLAPSGFLWASGGPDRPFEPHQDLDDGEPFEDWNDERLAADPGEFPFVSVYAPGDHGGCVCDCAPVLDAIAVEVPDEEEAA